MYFDFDHAESEHLEREEAITHRALPVVGWGVVTWRRKCGQGDRGGDPVRKHE